MKHRSYQALAMSFVLPLFMLAGCTKTPSADKKLGIEIQLTSSENGHMLTNRNVFSNDSQWVVYDTRPIASQFTGDTIEKVNVDSKEVVVLYRDPNGAKVGVVTYNPTMNQISFIKGPDKNEPDQTYSSYNRQGLLYTEQTGVVANLDARDLSAPFTAGALRGGTHVHIFNPSGTLVSNTYEDKVLSQYKEDNAEHQGNSRSIALSVLNKPVTVDAAAGNHNGVAYTFVASTLNMNAQPGSDDPISAVEEGFIGTNGYTRSDGVSVKNALAFEGKVVAANGKIHTEIFVIDLPDDLNTLASGSTPIEGTSTTRATPPAGVTQRRITFTQDDVNPGLGGPRHWLKTTTDGQKIVFYRLDDKGIAQAYYVSPNGGEIKQITKNEFPIASEFTISPDNKYIAYIADGSLFRTEIETGVSERLTEKTDSALLSSDAVVYSPDGKKIVYEKSVVSSADPSKSNWQLFLFLFQN